MWMWLKKTGRYFLKIKIDITENQASIKQGFSIFVDQEVQ